MVQRRAARFVTGEYRRTSSVSALIKTLECNPLAHRRAMSRVTMLYRVTHGLVDIPQDHFTPVVRQPKLFFWPNPASAVKGFFSMDYNSSGVL